MEPVAGWWVVGPGARAPGEEEVVEEEEEVCHCGGGEASKAGPPLVA